MNTPGRRKGEHRSAQHERTPMSTLAGGSQEGACLLDGAAARSARVLA
jgi:hypothetical protein